MAQPFEINCETFPPACTGNISTIVTFVIPFITLAAAVGFLIMLLYAAFTWLTAGGNPENVAKAWKIMTFAVLGLLMVILSFIAIKIIGVITGTSGILPF